MLEQKNHDLGDRESSQIGATTVTRVPDARDHRFSKVGVLAEYLHMGG
jgi:hypothetical protein